MDIRAAIQALLEFSREPTPEKAERLALLIGVGLLNLPNRKAWGAFPDVTIAEIDEKGFRQHSRYAEAKAGDVDAAYDLVMDYLGNDFISAVKDQAGDITPIIVSVHAVEGVSANVIPEVAAECLAGLTGWPVDTRIIQLNRVGHTKSTGFHRLQTPALFGGQVVTGASYVLVDDFIGQGGTLANLRGYIESNGGRVVAACVMAGKPFSAKLKLEHETLLQLRSQHGDLEPEWRSVFGYGFDVLTESEARYLIRTENADRIRSEVLAPAKAGNPSLRQAEDDA